ncbi:hypothetical protein Psch_01723 [Pelotomaculum schinkii]|uniref:Uncharacterized protein n=1 Tax=Pelotomaculum schinkii TaxID=78350 RepID=A0A4Y7RGN3_9FIRM|nr:hypothetical protein Psch_01723 [Pelotomaculum schinkii]TEB15114.1 hypothetical protein Psfp_02433 [Pelotomaculum sp. FP]
MQSATQNSLYMTKVLYSRPAQYARTKSTSKLIEEHQYLEAVDEMRKAGLLSAVSF